MTDTDQAHPFDDAEGLAWLRSQPDGRVTASAAELGRGWGWNRMRAGRRLKAWQEAGRIRRDCEAIIVTETVTAPVAEPVHVTVMSGPTVTPRFTTLVKLAAFVAAVVLACVSAAFSIDGLNRHLRRRILAGHYHGRSAGSRKVVAAGRALAHGGVTSAVCAGRDGRRADGPERGRRVRVPDARPPRTCRSH